MRTAAAALLCLLSSAATAATPVICPASLAVKPAAKAPAGWELIPPRYKIQLDGITIYDGHPNEMASLAPDELPARGGFDIMKWDVNDNTWLECRYSGTHSTIARKLPKGFKTCRAYYEHQQGSFGPFSKLECE